MIDEFEYCGVANELSWRGLYTEVANLARRMEIDRGSFQKIHMSRDAALLIANKFNTDPLRGTIDSSLAEDGLLKKYNRFLGFDIVIEEDFHDREVALGK